MSCPEFISWLTSLPWVLDVACRKDGGDIRRNQAPQNLTNWRRIALPVWPQAKTAKMGMAHKRLKAAWDPSYRAKLLESCFRAVKMPSSRAGVWVMGQVYPRG